ncbi:Gfo/Idh/MocA family oxidoreductase [Pseudonocardia sp. K10HN5]|uniref:Gfo/Idh/MocA family oxidoreductase n=1 Tax=Pseudonocardia acidicola TaxID=2724939 RepID=A0ABX1SBD9_9PSEU|nr:Gfo/Idh/MocA family oxidoreductase [Pseudonocardia acidicola]
MTRTLGVGIVGLSASGGWAAGAHVPALAAVPGYELRALSASSADTARVAGERHGVGRTFGSAAELAACEDVDLVVVTVQAARHRELVLPALEAGKAVYCEWPLATSEEEAAELTDLAAARRVRTAVGLQARSSPTIRYVRDLVADGWLGEVLSTSVVASGMSWGAEYDPRTSYLLDRTGGSTMLAIPFGHLVDALCACLGEFTEVSALSAVRRPEVREAGTGARAAMTSEDQVAVHGLLESGAVASLHFRGGRSHGTNLHWEINGTEGDLIVSGPHGHLQLAPVALRGARAGEELHELTVPARYFTVAGFRERAGHPAANLAAAYATLRAELDGVPVEPKDAVPDFAHGRRRHRLLDVITRSAATGRRLRMDED